MKLNDDSDSEQDEEDDEQDVVHIPREAPGFEKEIDDHDENEEKDDPQWGAFGQELEKYTSDASASSPSILSDDAESLRIQEDFTDSEIDDEELKKRRQKQDKQSSKSELHRKHRGTMNIKAMRHLEFSKSQVKVLGHKIKNRFSMKGKEPGGKLLLTLCE